MPEKDVEMRSTLKVGITHGDVNGVGYEIILKAIGDDEITTLFTPVVFGKANLAKVAKEKFDLPGLKLNVIDDASQAKDGVINLVDLKDVTPEHHPGEIRKDAGESAVEALETAIEALRKGQIDVLVTAPISKEAVHSENFNFPGHTEFLSERIGNGNKALMILCNEFLRVALLSIHVPINKISEHVTEENIIEAVEKFSATLKKDFGIVKPAIAVLGLNPHAGDGGVLGSEEEEIIKPAINKLIQKGILAFGPFPADGFFGHELYKKFDGVLAMYHDQGLAPFKTLARSGGVNYSAGLPFVRTSPDHGTAFDIAWQGIADSTSMREAIYLAIDIFRRRKVFDESAANPLKKYVHERPERHDRSQQKLDLNMDSDD